MRPIIGAFCLFAGMYVLASYVANTANYAWLAAFVVIVLLAVVTWKWEYFNGTYERRLQKASIDALGFPDNGCAHKDLVEIPIFGGDRMIHCHGCNVSVPDGRALSSN